MDTNNNPQLPNIFSIDFLKLYLRGIGQVMFQDHAGCGLLFLIGIFYGAYTANLPEVAWVAVIGTLSSTITGYLLKYPATQGISGLWGFNGVLVGCALPTFVTPTPLMWITLVLFSAMTTWIMVGLNHLLAPYKVSSFTFPFVLMTWFILMATRNMQGLPNPGLSTPALPAVSSGIIDTYWLNLVYYWLKGIGQVFLIDSHITGILFLLGLLISNLRAAIWAAIGSAFALGLAILYQGNGGDIVNGLFGFSPVLTAIALGITFYQPNWKTAIWTLFGIFASFFIQAAMDTLFAPIGIPTFTAPFCIATWLFLLPHLELDKKRLH